MAKVVENKNGETSRLDSSPDCVCLQREMVSIDPHFDSSHQCEHEKEELGQE